MVGKDVDEFVRRGCVGDVDGDGHVCQSQGGALAGVGDGGGVFQYGWGVDDGCRLWRARGWRRSGRRRSVLRLYGQQAGKQARGDVGVQAGFCSGGALPLAAGDNGSRRLPRARAPEGPDVQEVTVGVGVEPPVPPDAPPGRRGLRSRARRWGR